MKNNEKMVNYFREVIKIIKTKNDGYLIKLSDGSMGKKINIEFLNMLDEQIQILNISELISSYTISWGVKKDFFKDFFTNFYSFLEAEEHALNNLGDLYYIKEFHENQIIKLFDEEFDSFEIYESKKNFIFIFATLLEQIKINNKDEVYVKEFQRFQSKWWIYYMIETGGYEKFKKIIIQRILSDYVLSDKVYNSKLNLSKYKNFEEYLKKYSIESSKISKLLFLTLIDNKNKIQWFNLFSYLDIKNFKKYIQITSFVKEGSFENIDKFLNLNKNIKKSTQEIYSLLSSCEIGYLFLKNKIIKNTYSTNNYKVEDTSFFLYMIYLLKYNNQETKINKFLNDYWNDLSENTKLEEELTVKEWKSKIIKSIVIPGDNTVLSQVQSSWHTMKSFFPTLPLDNFENYKKLIVEFKENNVIEYLNNDFDSDVADFLIRNKKIIGGESNIKHVINQEDKIGELKKKLIFDFIAIFLIMRGKGKLSPEQIDGLLSYFITQFEQIYNRKYEVIKTNYELLNKENIILHINEFLNEENKLKNIKEVKDDIWMTFIEYDLLSLKDIRNWSKYEQKGDKIYSIIINKLIISGSLREAWDKSVYESSIFQNKIFQKMNIQKHLVKSGILWKANYESADYLEYLLFALHENYGYKVAEEFLVNLLKSVGEFRESRKRDIATLIRVPFLCINEERDEYYVNPYHKTFEFHIRLFNAIRDFYTVDYLMRQQFNFPYYSQINHENEMEIFEVLTRFFEDDSSSFDEYIRARFKKVE